MKRNNFTHSTPATTMKIILLIMVFSLVLATVLSQKIYFDDSWREDNETVGHFSQIGKNMFEI